jgi:nucleoside-diphosphate-sugar epimerase
VSAFGSADLPPRNHVAVLGASGFLGRHVCRRLTELGISHTTIGRTRRPDVDAAIDLVTAGQQEVNQLLHEICPTAVINCSGAVRGSVGDLTRGNVVAAHALLSALGESAPSARLVQLGSSAEYGAVAVHEPMDERTPTLAGSPYGFTKLAASELVQHARAGGIDAIVLRIFNVSGPESPTSTMLGGLVEQLANAGSGPSVTVDSLDGWRDYVDVRDVANAICLAAISQTVPPVANIGSGTPIQTRDWVAQLIAVSGTNARVIEKDDPSRAHKASAATVAWQCADITTATTHLDWSPAIDVATSIRDTWEARMRVLGQ